jgi:hypothetical protein
MGVQFHIIGLRRGMGRVKLGNPTETQLASLDISAFSQPLAPPVKGEKQCPGKEIIGTIRQQFSWVL